MELGNLKAKQKARLFEGSQGTHPPSTSFNGQQSNLFITKPFYVFSSSLEYRPLIGHSGQAEQQMGAKIEDRARI